MPRKTPDLADSGNRTEQYGGAVRDREPGKGRFDLLSPFFLQALAEHAEKGAVKYAPASGDTSHRNWERGYSIALCMDSAMRHLNQFAAGDTSEDHVVAAAWNLMAIYHVREMIERDALPDDLARGYLPLHMANPITKDVEKP